VQVMCGILVDSLLTHPCLCTALPAASVQGTAAPTSTSPPSQQLLQPDDCQVSVDSVMGVAVAAVRFH